jgi:predicted DNA-binding transcriptional regulator AlpA
MPRKIPTSPHRRRFVRFRELRPLYGIDWSRVHCDRLSRAGKFVRKVHLGPNTMGYWSDELEAFLKTRDAEADAPRTYPILQAPPYPPVRFRKRTERC